MLLNNKGFTLVEVLIAFSLIIFIAMTFIPVTTLIEKESRSLSNMRVFSNILHDELQEYIWLKKELPIEAYTRKVNGKKIILNFLYEEELIKGCVSWENNKNKKEIHCLYGIPE